MDGRGRLAQSVTWIAPWRARPSGRARAASNVHAGKRVQPAPMRSGAGIAASGLFLLATLTYGIVIGDRAPMLVAAFKDSRDAAANAAGLPLLLTARAGGRRIEPERDLCRAGGDVTG